MKLNCFQLTLLVVMLLSDVALGNESDVEILANPTNGGLGFELVQKGLEQMQYSFMELFVHVKELGELVQNNQRSIEQSQLQTNQLIQRHQRYITDQVDELKSEVAANVSLMTSYSKQILDHQTICANHDLIKKELQKMKPRAIERSSVQTLTSTLFSSESKLEQSDPKVIDSCENSDEPGLYNMSIPNKNEPVTVFCDGKWLVVQQRINGKVDFYRNWTEYKNGFGIVGEEFWMGLDVLHEITNSDQYELLIDMRDFSDENLYARYSHFVVGNEDGNYALEKLGSFSGIVYDSLNTNLNGMFSTFDVDNDDVAETNCALEYTGAWWWHGGESSSCSDCNLNGKYRNSNDWKAITWKSSAPLKYTRMMIRKNERL